ncbi:hypothetical protein [Rhodopirellula sp. P2]|uniref:hypothetical protein n=1 Tax=Rhodopirellula sp. P2 TaxID=2127060 RepID=UPI00236758DB|nr:hypothetical protein [Rhodopirellula sp. P2]WDQ15440.1 hypothetical protein PSR62_17560 [Rhodopirellula sp. P2]
MIAIQLLRLTGPGTFHADFYYIPLREFVDPDQHDAMEQLVIAKYDAASSTSANLWLLGLVPVLICVVLARHWMPLQTTESQSDG